MSKLTAESNEFSKLRADAEVRLKEGSAPPTKDWPTGASALTLLHKLASAPASAADALKLLHELQVHQVELDLQHEQMETTQRELTEHLARYKKLYEFAPVGYFRVDHQGNIIEGNLAGASLFGVGQNELHGRQIGSFLAPKNRPIVLELLKRLRNSGSREICEVQFDGGNISRRIQIVANTTPGGGSYLMVFVDTTNLRSSDERA